MGVRNRARKFLLQARYAAEFNGDGIRENLDRLGISERFQPAERSWIAGLASIIEGRRPQVDEAVAAHLRNWSFARLHVLMRLILEQGYAEAAFAGTDRAVAIDEYVDLAHEFLDPDGAGFVNGVLDRALTTADG